MFTLPPRTVAFAPLPETPIFTSELLASPSVPKNTSECTSLLLDRPPPEKSVSAEISLLPP